MKFMSRTDETQWIFYLDSERLDPLVIALSNLMRLVRHLAVAAELFSLIRSIGRDKIRRSHQEFLQSFNAIPGYVDLLFLSRRPR